MNRFLLLTGIGPTVSRDDALTWIQVVFPIVNTINIFSADTNIFGDTNVRKKGKKDGCTLA